MLVLDASYWPNQEVFDDEFLNDSMDPGVSLEIDHDCGKLDCREYQLDPEMWFRYKCSPSGVSQKNKNKKSPTR